MFFTISCQMMQLDQADCRKLCKSGGGAQPKVLVVGWAVAEWWWPGAGQWALCRSLLSFYPSSDGSWADQTRDG